MPTQVSCPHCKVRVPYEGNPHRPFCSKRCRMMDLGAWANEEYRVEAKEMSMTTSDQSNWNSDPASEEDPESA